MLKKLELDWWIVSKLLHSRDKLKRKLIDCYIWLSLVVDLLVLSERTVCLTLDVLRPHADDLLYSLSRRIDMLLRWVAGYCANWLILYIYWHPPPICALQQLHDFLTDDLAQWYPEIAPHVKITLVEALPNVLPMFSKQLMWVRNWSIIEQLSRMIQMLTLWPL